MNSEQFIQDAVKTESRPDTLAVSPGSLLTALEVMIAAAGAADTLKRALYYGKPLDVTKLQGQLVSVASLANTLRHYAPGMQDPANVGDNSVLAQPDLRLLHGAIGIFTESGEMLEAIRNQMITGKLDTVNFGEETGDVDWYKAIIHDATGVSEEATRAAVIAKLKLRYPGKFDADAANKRDLGTERASLEQSLEGAAQ